MKSILTRIQVLSLLIALPALAGDVGLHNSSAQPTHSNSFRADNSVFEDVEPVMVATSVSSYASSKGLIYSEVVGPNTKYVPDSFSSTNILTPEDYAAAQIVDEVFRDKPSEGYDPAYHDMFDSLVNNAVVTVITPPKHGKLLPVQVEESKGFFYMAELGYYGTDKIVFKIKFGNGKTEVVTNIISVVDFPNPDFNGTPRSPAEYREMRRTDPDEIRRRWEEQNRASNGFEEALPFSSNLDGTDIESSLRLG